MEPKEKKELFVNVEKKQVFLRNFLYIYNTETQEQELIPEHKIVREMLIEGGWTPICYVPGWNTVLWGGDYKVITSRTALKEMK